MAELANTGKKYAIKVIRKDKIIDTQMIEGTFLEMNIMFDANHPFLCGLDFFFQTEERLYFVMPYISGGELLKTMKNHGCFSEEIVKFYAT